MYASKIPFYGNKSDISFFLPSRRHSSHGRNSRKTITILGIMIAFVKGGGCKGLTYVFLFCKIFPFPHQLRISSRLLVEEDRLKFYLVYLLFLRIEEKWENFDHFRKHILFSKSLSMDHFQEKLF